MLIALWIFLSHSAMAINYQRIESGKWSEADKWSPKGVPGAADNATISGSLVVEIDLFDGVSVHDLTFNGFRITGKKTLKIEGDLTMTDGSLETIVPVIVKGNLLLSGGTINTNMSVLGAFKWSGGVFGNKGSTVTVTGLARLTGKEKYITKNTLILNGGGEWTSGNLEINSAGVLQIPSGRTFTVSTETKLNFVSSTLGGGKVENSGTFIKNGAGNLECELTRFNNSQTGVLQINNGGKMVCRGGAGLGGALQLSQENQLN